MLSWLNLNRDGCKIKIADLDIYSCLHTTELSWWQILSWLNLNRDGCKVKIPDLDIYSCLHTNELSWWQILNWLNLNRDGCKVCRGVGLRSDFIGFQTWKFDFIECFRTVLGLSSDSRRNARTPLGLHSESSDCSDSPRSPCRLGGAE